MNPELQQRLRQAHDQLAAKLLGELNADGHWTGELSSSALSTAVATIALGELDRQAGTRENTQLVQNGLHWLAQHANPDGGWGDTVRSQSNLSTTALVWAAFGAAHADEEHAGSVSSAVEYIKRQAGSVENLVPAIEALYGKDRTFSVPITMTLALSGRLGEDGWQRVRPLPFELAALPRGLFGALRLPVVSYALPALIAIGQVIHRRSGRLNPLRSLAQQRTLKVLTTLQPDNGGFLEATPLTAFVTMSLAGMGEGRHVAARKGASFLRASVRADGSWPIDTNLATWVTTLSIKALSHRSRALSERQRVRLREWLLGQQYQVVHPYTGAAPGAWAWTDLPGGVPDADDTAGALLALHHLKQPDGVAIRAAEAGIRWLLDLQNRDGGIPTFCRGWGTLPFDRSTPELTAHALRAWTIWRSELRGDLAKRLEVSIGRALAFLARSQRADGAWIPLWFGNEHAAEHENPVYGTAQVLIGLNEICRAGLAVDESLRIRAAEYLVRVQGADGGWGGDESAPASLEEIALALEALNCCPNANAAVDRGARRLLAFLEAGATESASPIGLYFARLWYFERLYPLIFTTSAVGTLTSKDDCDRK